MSESPWQSLAILLALLVQRIAAIEQLLRDEALYLCEADSAPEQGFILVLASPLVSKLAGYYVEFALVCNPQRTLECFLFLLDHAETAVRGAKAAYRAMLQEREKQIWHSFRSFVPPGSQN